MGKSVSNKIRQVVVSMFLGVMGVWGAVCQLPMAHADARDLHITVNHDQLTMQVHDALLVEVVERVTQILFLTCYVDPDLEKMPEGVERSSKGVLRFLNSSLFF